MKTLVTLLLACYFGSAGAAQKVCVGTDVEKWDSCVAYYVNEAGGAYLGEFKNGKYDGYGSLRDRVGMELQTGIWKEGNFRSGQRLEAEVEKLARQHAQSYGTRIRGYLARDQAFSRPPAETSLSPCKGSDPKPALFNWKGWDGCFGVFASKYGTYEGEFKEAQFHGVGVMAYENGSWYSGEWKFGQRDGYGRLTTNGGDVMEGYWRAGSPDGMVKKITGDGAEFIGTYVDGNPSGNGRINFRNGLYFLGSWKGQNISGTLYSSNGLALTDEKIWSEVDLKRTAVNTSSLTATSSRQPSSSAVEMPPELKTQLAEADGKIKPTTPEPSEFENLRAEAEQAKREKAELEAQLATGALNKQLASYLSCEGEVWRWNDCFGTYINSKGFKYVGSFKNGNYHGLGIEFRPDGVALAAGIYEKDKFVRAVDAADQLRRKQAELEGFRAESAKANSASDELENLRAEAEQAKREKAELEAELAAVQQAQVRPASPVGPALSVHAIVIGNGAYQGSGRLDNPINDARAISAKLKRMGFKVTTVENADRNKLVSSLVKFSSSAAESDLTLFFYAGHGVQISGTNYMLPTDTNLNQIGGVELHGISLNSVVDRFLPGKTKLVFLDACRDNPLLQVASRSVSRGLAPISVSQGTLISYATKDGSVAADGDGKNSPFTKALLQHIDSPEDIAVVLRKVRDQVMRDTGGQQQPWEYGSLSGGSLILSAIRAK